jgi:putative hydrolase of the HAD superfamily
VSPEKCGSAKPSAVLLDLDGVLIDHRTAARDAVRAWLGDRATPAVETAWFAAQDRRLAEWRRGEATWQEQRRARLRDVLPLLGEEPGSDAELDALFASGYAAAYARSWRAFPDAAPALEALGAAGLRPAVLTNGAEDVQARKLEVTGLRDLVGDVVTAEALGVAKPAPAAFLGACERLGLDPATTLYVGDEHEVDVLGARAAGLHAVLLDRDGDAPPEERAVIRSLAELPALLPLLLP